jgi:hypothetical protein
VLLGIRPEVGKHPRIGEFADRREVDGVLHEACPVAQSL